MAKRSGDRRVSVRVADHRARLRGEGLKPVQMWLPDTSNTDVRAELAAVCQAIEAYPGAAGDAAFAYALALDDQ